MPSTGFLQLEINSQPVELGEVNELGVSINYTLEYPESWENKQSSDVQGISLPATCNNDQVFNTFHNIAVEDNTPGQIHRNLMPFTLQSNGVTILQGKARLNGATYTDRPEAYNISLEGGNGDWLLDGQNLTIWDCVNPNPHTFDVATVQDSWTDFDTDEDHDYVYAPVRYRQPFNGEAQDHGTDDTVNIYMLRPSLSVYWLIIRGFRQMGYTVKSDFFETLYFRGLVMPWTWGDFFDINSQITDGLSFKAAGPTPGTPPIGYTEFVSGFPIYFGGSVGTDPSLDIDNTGWKPWGPAFGGGTYIDSPASPGYIENLTTHDSFANTYYHNFIINNEVPPAGYDNFGLYSFDIPTGTMEYTLTVPPALSSFIGSDITCNFALSLFCKTFCAVGGNHVRIYIEVTKNGVFQFDEEFTELSVVSGETRNFLLFPTVHTFSVSGLNDGDVLEFRLKHDVDTTGDAIILCSSLQEDVNPSTTGASNWQYNYTTEEWENIGGGITTPDWQKMYSTLSMTGLQLELGGQVHFQWYDSFRNYKFFDMLGGIVDMFDLEVQTNPMDKTVTIEPFSNATLSDGTDVTSYFDTERVVDWSAKQDLGVVNEVKLFAESERQIDFNLKQDGSDGGQNIWAARYKGSYLNNVKRNTISNGQINNGVVAAVPGASRYMLPNRFSKGNKQKSNRFFSAVMHYKHEPWANLWPDTPASQLICIIPENVSDSSSGAITQVFEPKLAFYAGLQSFAGAGAWRWIGDPASPWVDGGTPNAIGFNLPYMFAVDYTGHVATVPGQVAPVLTYSDQNVNGDVVPGLMRTWFLKRMAIMRNGQLLNANFRLNLDDICRFEHREVINLQNKGTFALIGIDGYNPLSDASCKCTMWKMVDPEETDANNSYPSGTSILTNPSVLDQYDLRYAKQLLFYSDIPQ